MTTRRLARVGLPVVVLVVASAHAVVSPAASRTGAYERYVLRVPNESDNPTVKIEITFPPDVRVISFVDVPGWQLQAKMDSTGRAMSATWTGTLPPERFVELPFIGVNPKTSARVTWPVIQTYANGVRAEWTSAAGSDHPASATEIGGESPISPGTLMGALALLLAAVAVVITLGRGSRVA